jgi:hypothetical protein
MEISIDIDIAIQQATQFQAALLRSIQQAEAAHYMALMNKNETLQGSAKIEVMTDAYKNIVSQSDGAISALNLVFKTVSALLISLKEAKAEAEADAADA